MILKDRDPKTKEIEELKQLLSSAFSEKQRFVIEREIDSTKKGISGEDDSAYYINFYYGNSENWVVIHDLRIEHEGIVAQIDHILINRLFDFYILESKSYKNGIKITDNGEFEAFYNNKYFGIPSPIEQNERHIFALNKFMTENNILPKRMGVTIKPTYYNYVLISPASIIKRPNIKKFNTDNVIKADTLKTIIEKNADRISPISDFVSVTKISSLSTIEETANKIISMHKPKEINWKAKFGVKNSARQHSAISDNSSDTENTDSKYYCAKCKKSISPKVAKFCWNNKKRFNSKAFCYNCQKLL